MIDFEAVKDKLGEYIPPPIHKLILDYEDGVLEINDEKVEKPILIVVRSSGSEVMKIFNFDKENRMNNIRTPVLRLNYEPGTGEG